jgi:predicted amidohydrolase
MRILFLALVVLYVVIGLVTGSSAINYPKFAVAQLNYTHVGDFAYMLSMAQFSASQGAKMIIFPEESVFGWLNPAVFTNADSIPGIYSAQFQNIARTANIWVATGIGERGPQAANGALFNAYHAYDSALLIDPAGTIVLHHRKYNVLVNAFNGTDCERIFKLPDCNYTAGDVSDITTVMTPWGRTGMLVCSDAYLPGEYNDGNALKAMKALKPDFVIVPWGVAASSISECGTAQFDATYFAAQAAQFIGTGIVAGANAVGARNYGRFLPSVYCGDSGYGDSHGGFHNSTSPYAPLLFFNVTPTSSIQTVMKHFVFEGSHVFETVEHLTKTFSKVEL